jgi:Lrp/AsnC family transcriptional regulator, leucine-responsive regulatory protein
MDGGAVDELDRELLRHLADDARLTMAELGRRVGLSRTAVLARVRRLEDDGVILGYRAEVRPDAAARSHVARVGIVLRTPDVAAYVRRLAGIAELEQAESVAGEFDLLVRFAADSAERLDAILDRIGGWRETVRTTTWIVLREYR